MFCAELTDVCLVSTVVSLKEFGHILTFMYTVIQLLAQFPLHNYKAFLSPRI